MRSISFEEATAVGGGMIGAGSGNYLLAAGDDDHELTVYGDPWTDEDEAQYQAELEAQRWCGPVSTVIGLSAGLVTTGACLAGTAIATLGVSSTVCSVAGGIVGAGTMVVANSVCNSAFPKT